MIGHIHGISSSIFFFMLFALAVLLAVIENLCDSSRAFWSTMSSGVPFSKIIGFFAHGRNISSSRFAMEHIATSPRPSPRGEGDLGSNSPLGRRGDPGVR